MKTGTEVTQLRSRPGWYFTNPRPAAQPPSLLAPSPGEEGALWPPEDLDHP